MLVTLVGSLTPTNATRVGHQVRTAFFESCCSLQKVDLEKHKQANIKQYCSISKLNQDYRTENGLIFCIRCYMKCNCAINV